MAGKKSWINFDDATDLIEKIALLDQSQPVERLINLCSEDMREHISPFAKETLLNALLITACGSGEVRSRRYYAPRKHEPVPPDMWLEVYIDAPWANFCTEDIEINEADLRHWLAKQLSRRAGRKPKVDWDGVVKRRLFELLDHHGPPDASDPEWSCQADVEAAVAKICGVLLSESTIRSHTARLISEWQRKKARN